MQNPENNDRMFDENLRVFGQGTESLPGADEALRSRCADAMNANSAGTRTLRFPALRRPALLSTMGLAASIALVVGWLAPWQTTQTVQAAEILSKLNNLSVEGQLLDIRIDSVALDEVFLNGHLQVSDQGVAGDIQVSVDEGDEGLIEIDLALGISEEEGWVLLRKLTVPDPTAAVIIGLVLPPGTETLLLLPESIREEIGSEVHEEISDAIAEISTGQVAEVLEEIIRSHEEVGATVDKLRDGTIQLTLPIKDEGALEALAELLTRSIEEKVEAQRDDDSDESDTRSRRKGPPAHVSVRGNVHDDGDELIGSTLMVVYDPAKERVRSFGIFDFGERDGSITVDILDEAMDPALLDASRVTTGATRTIDLDQLEGLIHGLNLDR